MESEIKAVFQYRAPGGRVVEGEFAAWRVADEKIDLTPQSAL